MTRHYGISNTPTSTYTPPPVSAEDREALLDRAEARAAAVKEELEATRPDIVDHRTPPPAPKTAAELAHAAREAERSEMIANALRGPALSIDGIWRMHREAAKQIAKTDPGSPEEQQLRGQLRAMEATGEANEEVVTYCQRGPDGEIVFEERTRKGVLVRQQLANLILARIEQENTEKSPG